MTETQWLLALTVTYWFPAPGSWARNRWKLVREPDTYLSPVIPQVVGPGRVLGPQARIFLAGMVLELLTQLGTLRRVGGPSYSS